VELAPTNPTSVNADDRLVEDLGFHSLVFVELAFALEDAFDLEPIDEERAEGIVTVEDVEALVLRETSGGDIA
jgi:acyl carrier protein